VVQQVVQAHAPQARASPNDEAARAGAPLPALHLRACRLLLPLLPLLLLPLLLLLLLLLLLALWLGASSPLITVTAII
jgi:hypothetical protein